MNVVKRIKNAKRFLNRKVKKSFAFFKKHLRPALVIFFLSAIAIIVAVVFSILRVQLPQKAAEVNMVQRGSVSMSSATQNVTITAVDTTKSFVLCHTRTDSSQATNSATCHLTNGTTLTVQTQNANAALVVDWKVVEFTSGVTVQRGVQSFSNGNTSRNVTVSAVDLSKTFVLTSTRINNTDTAVDERRMITAQMTSTTNLQLQRSENGASAEVAWQVIQIDDANVQSGVATIANGATSQTASITAVNPSKSFLVFTSSPQSSVNGVERNYMVRGNLSSATGLTFTRRGSSGTVTIPWFVVEMTDGTTVQRGSVSASNTETSLNAGITSVDLSRSVPIISSDVIDAGAATSPDDLDSGSWTASLSSPNNLQFQRGSGQDRPSTINWQVIEFDDATAVADFTACRTETGTTIIPASSASANVTLTTPITDTNQAFLLVDSSGVSNVNGGDDHMVSGFVASANTLTFQRGAASSDQAEVSYQLVECFNDEFTVQRGEIVVSSGNIFNTATISSVDTANSMVIVSSRTTDSNAAEDQALVTGELTDATTVRVERAVSGTSNTSVRYQVVQFAPSSGVTLRKGTAVLNSGAQTQTATITTVDPTSSWVYCSWDASDNGLQQTAVGCELQNATTVAFHRFGPSAYTNRIRYTVVEFPATQVTVQRGVVANDPGSAANTRYDHDIAISSISSLSKAFAFVTNTTSGTGTAFPRNKWIEFLTSLTNLRTSFWHGADTGAFDDNVKYWQVIEFSPSINGAPTGVFNSTTGTSGNIQLSLEIDDVNDDDIRARIEYETDTDGACNGPWANATLVVPTTADFTDAGGVPDVNNGSSYQLGSGTNTRIVTSSGSNTVTVYWNSFADLPSANGTRCLRLTANDNVVDQITPNTIVLTVNNQVSLNQKAYRFYGNINSANVGTPTTAQDGTTTLAYVDEKFRLRILVESANALSANAGNWKLQFSARGSDGSCDAGFVGESYTDVTNSSAIAFYDNATPNDGDAAIANANDPVLAGTTVLQTYEETGSFTNPNAVASGNNALWDFSLFVNGAVTGKAYCFRIVDTADSPLAGYTVIPTVRTLPDTYLVCDDNNQLQTLDTATGARQVIGGTGVLNIEAIAYDSGTYTLYAADAGNFGTLNKETGVFNSMGQVDGGGCANGAQGCIGLNDVDGLAFDVSSRQIWASHRTSTGVDDVLFRINPATGQFIPNAFGPGVDYIPIGGTGVYDLIDDIAIRPSDGKMFTTGNNGTVDQLLNIDKQTGAVTIVAPINVNDFEGADYRNDNVLMGLRGIANEYRTINDVTGATSNIISLASPACGDPEAIAAATRPANQISGTVFYDDTPQNAAFDFGETGIPNVQVRLFRDSNTNGVVDATDQFLQSTLTDASGNYLFLYGTIGQLVIEIDTTTLPAGYSLTTDNVENAMFTNAVNFGEFDTDNNFGANTGADCDGDGIPNFVEDAPPGIDSDGDGIENQCDLDSDNDGVTDAIEGTNDRDEDGILNYIDLDSDNDGIPDAREANGGNPPSGYNATTGRLTGTDADSDGLLDQVDSAPALQYGTSTTTLPLTNVDGDARRDYLDGDSDNDGILDVVEGGGSDANGDGLIDGFTDVNSDGYHDPLATTPLAVPNTDTVGRFDYQDQDSDGDGIPDFREAQTGVGYVVPAIIEDLDGDGIIDSYDVSQGGVGITPIDTDGDGLRDYVDTNSDNDGVPDLIEGHDADFNGVANNNPTGSDTDGDGIDNGFDTDNANAQWFYNNIDVNATVQNFDGTDNRDWRDNNDDNDGFDTVNENFNANGTWADDFTQGCSPRPDYYCYTQPVDVSVVKSVNVSNPSVGGTIIYTITATNNGPVTATAVQITDLLPSGVTYVSSTPSQGTYTTGTGVWTIGTMANGAAVNLQITATVDSGSAGATIANTATLTNITQGDSNTANNSSTANITVKAADLHVTKTVNTPAPNEGQNVTFTISVTNNGPSNATNVAITDILPSGLTYVSNIPSQGTYVSGTGIWTVGAVNNGATATLQLTASVDAGTGGTIIANTSTVTNSSEGDPDPGDNSDTEQVDVQLADLSLTKIVDDATPSEGDTVVYTVTVTNDGPDTATGVTIQDLLPAGVTHVSNTPSQGSYVSGTGVWTVGTINNGANATLNITATVDTGTAGTTIVNNAQVQSSSVADPDSTPGNTSGTEDDESSAPISVRSADLSLTKIVDDATPNEGQTIVYTITVGNAGPDTAEAVQVNDLLPSGVTYVSDAPSQGSYIPGTGLWTIGNITNGGSATLNITANVNGGTAGTTIQNAAEISASGTGDPDSTPGNASGTEDDEDTVDITVTNADLAVTKTVNNGAPNEEENVTYTVTITNNGPDNATGVQVTDLLPSGVTYVSNVPSQGSYVSGTGVWTVGSISNGANATIQITGTVNSGTQGTVIGNTATVTGSDQGDSVPGNNSDSADIDVQSADLSLTKIVNNTTPNEGDTVTYTITVTNAGPDTATGVVVEDFLPGGVTYVSNTASQGSYVSGTGVWTVGTINNGANATLQISATINNGTAGATIVNSAQVDVSDVADPDSTPGNSSGTEDDEASVSLVVGNADLAVTKVVDNASPDVGETVTFTITIDNNGPSNATGVVLNDLLPSGVTYVSNTPSQGTYVPGSGVWTVGAINNGANATLDIIATVDAGQGGQAVSNTATITASDVGDSVPGNNSDSAGLNVPQVDLSLTKIVDNATPNEGDTVVYTITVANAGPDAAAGVDVTDLLPLGVTYVSDTPSQGSYVPGTGIWNVGTINNGANATIQLSATVDSGTGGSTIQNDAEVTASDSEDADSTPGNSSGTEDDEDSATITVTSTDLEVVKTVNNGTPNEGDTVVFTITLSNNGPDDATGVELTDLLPVGLTYVSSTPSQGSYVSGTGVWTVGALNAVAQATLDITATVDAGTQGTIITNVATVTNSDQGDPDPGDNSDSAAVDVKSADLSLTKVASQSSPGEGDTFTYTITLTNSGPDSADSVVLQDVLPSGITYVSDVASQGSYTSGTGIWTVGAIANGASATIDITVSVNSGTAGQTIVNSTEVLSSATADPDSTPGNTSGTEDDETSESITVMDADLAVLKTVNDSTPRVGDTVVYTVTVTNNGSDNATGVIVSDLLPSGVTYVSDTPSQGTYAVGSGVWTVGAVNNGASATLNITVTIDAGTSGTNISNTANISNSDQGDSVLGNNSDNVDVTVEQADLSLTQTVNEATPREGDTVVYTITVANDGPDAANVEVTDVLPTGITYVSDTPSQGSYVVGTGVWTVGSISNGGNATLDITATVNAGTSGTVIANTVEITSSDQEDPDSTPGNASTTEDDDDTVSISVESADLEIVKTVNNSTPNEGDTIVYTLTVTNNGPNDTTGVQVMDLLPAGVTYVSSTPSQGSYVSGTGVWTIGALNTSSQVTIDITATVDEGTQNTIITNTATITGSDQGDPDPGDNSDSTDIDVQSADLSLTKVVDDATPSEGDTVVYTMTVANGGPDAATGVVVQDLLPSGVTYVSDTPSQGTYVSGTGVWTIGTINNGANVMLQITATVNGGMAGQTIVNAAEVSSSDVADPDSTPGNSSGTEDDEASASLLVADADLAVTKTVNDATPDVGQAITYTITITNNGPNNASSVELTDVLPAGLTYVSNTPSQGFYTFGTGVWDVGVIANGGNATLQITATVDVGQGGNTISNIATITGSGEGDSVPGNNSDNVDVTVTLIDLSLTKFVDDSTPRIGDTVVYTVTVSNAGPDAAEGVEVTDLLPSGVTYVSDTPSQGSYISGTGIWTVGTINNGGSATIAISATVNSGEAANTIQNNTEVTSAGQEDSDSTPGNTSGTEDDEASASFLVESADLEIVKTVDNTDPNEGDTVVFSLTVTNNGPNDTTGVEIMDLLPSGLTYVSHAFSQGSYVPGTGIWTVGSLAVSNQATLDITATVDAGTQNTIIVNTATVTGSDQGDPDPGDNTDTASVDVQSADLRIVKNVDVPSPTEGQTITYLLTLTNDGPDAATGIVVTDLLPSGVTYVTDVASQGSYVSGTGVWTVGTIANGGSATLDITATVDGGTAGSTIVNNIEVTASDVADPDSIPGNTSGTEDDEDSVSILVADADLAVTKTVDDATPDVGQTIVYTVTLTNNGPDDATGVQLTDVLPSGVTYVSDVPSQGSYVAGTGVWTVGAVNNGASATLQISATVDAGQGGNTINNTASITGTDQGDTNSGNNSDNVDVTVTLIDLSLTKSVDDATPRVGDTVVYTVTVSNAGPDVAEGVEVTDLLPAGVTYVSDAPSQGSYVSGTGLWTVGAIANGGNATLNISATVDAGTAASTIQNNAEVTGAQEEDSDSTPANTSGTEDDEDFAQITVESADLEIVKTVDDGTPNEGDTIVFTLTVTNNGPNDTTGVEITDLLPAGVTYVSDSPSQGSYVSGTGIWTVGALAASNQVTLDITATVDAGTGGSILVNTATVTGSDQGDPDPGDNSDTANVDVQLADLELTKAFNVSGAGEGDTVVATLTLNNNGPDAATNVSVVDLLPAGMTYVSNTPSQGSYVSGTGVWTVGTVTGGGSATLQISATVNAGTAGQTIVNIAEVTASDVADPDSTPGNTSSTEDDESSDSITVGDADLSIVKDVNDSTPRVGDTVVYTLTVTNNGPDDTTSVVVNDALPSGVTYVSDSPSQGSYVPGTGVWSVGAVNNGANATLNITGTIDAGEGGNTIVNTATVTGDQGDSVPGNNSDDASLTVETADIELTKSVDESAPAEGEAIVFTLTATNYGPDTASISVTDVLPSGVTYVSDSSSQGSYVSGTGVWTVGSILNGGNATLQITATVDAGTAGVVMTNSAEVSASDQEDGDSTPGNTSGTEDDEDSVAVTVRNADLAVTKTVDDATPNDGDTIVFTLTVTNNGPNDTTGVEITDLLPAGVTYVSDSPSQGSYVSGTGVWTVGSMTNGSNATINITATVDAGTQGTVIGNTATLTASDEGDSVPGNNSDSVDIDVQSADLELTKMVDVLAPNEGATVIFTVSVANNGPDAAENVVVQDLLPAGVTFVSSGTTQGSYVSGTGIWTIGTIAASSTAQLDIEVTVDGGTAGTTLQNNAEVSATDTSDPDSTPGNTSGTEDDEDSVIIDVTNTDLAVTKIVDDATPDEGGTIVYTVTITNNGPDDATGVEVIDLLPAGVTYVNVTASQGSYVSGTGIWTVGSLLNGASANINITATVDAGTSGTTINNAASVTASDQGDTNSANNSDDVDITVTLIDLSLTKTVDDSTPREGDTVVYTVTVSNAGPSFAEGVEVTDLLPTGVTYVSDVPSQGSYVSGTGVWTVGTINNGTSATLNITTTVDAGTAGTTIQNDAEVTNTTQVDSDSTPGNTSGTEDDEDSASIAVEFADLEIVKSVDDAVPGEGDTIEYTVTVTNNGPNDTTGVVVSDVLPSGVTYVSDAASQGSYVSGTGVWSIGALNVSASVTLTLTATVDAGTGGSNIVNTATITDSDQADPDTGDNSDSADIDVIGNADIAVTKSVDDANPQEGDTVVYTIALTNNGPVDASSIVLADAVPAGLSYASHSASQGFFNSGSGVWTVGDVANGAGVTLDITVTVDGGTAGQTINNTVIVTSLDEHDPVSSNDQDDQDVIVQSVDIAVDKTVDDTAPTVGGTVVYTIKATNNGPNDVTGIEITDTLPSGVTYLSSSPSQGTYISGTGVWSVGAIANGANATLNITATVNTGTSGNVIVNIAELTGSDITDINPGNNSDGVSITPGATVTTGGGGSQPIIPNGSLDVQGVCLSDLSATVTLTATNATQYKLSEDAYFTGANWQSFTANPTLLQRVLSSGSGTKTLYAIFRSNTGNISQVTQDSIVVDLEDGCTFPPAPEPEPEPETPEIIEPPAVGGACFLDCDRLYYDIYIVNPDGTERHMNSRYAKFDNYGDNTGLVRFEDKGSDFDYNDVLVNVDKRDCSNIRFDLSLGEARWDHEVRATLLYRGTTNKQDMQLWPSSQDGQGTAAFVDATVFDDICLEQTEVPQCTVDCSKLDYDIFIVNPDGTERHMNTNYAQTTDLEPGIRSIRFEDKGEDFDYNDVFVTVDSRSCNDIQVSLDVGAEARWSHQVHANLVYEGSPYVKDLLLWSDSQRSAGTTIRFDANDYPQICEEAIEIPYEPCDITCSKVSYDLFIENPDGSERHMYSRFTQVEPLGENEVLVKFEDGGNEDDADFNDVWVRVSRNTCENIQFKVENVSANWNHKIKVRLKYEGIEKEEIVLWADSHDAEEVRTINVDNFPNLCLDPSLVQFASGTVENVVGQGGIVGRIIQGVRELFSR